MNPDAETWHVHPLALHFMKSPVAILAMVVGIVVVWAAVSWWTDRRWRRRRK